MLSNSSKYALKAVLFLALYSSAENIIQAKDISQLTGIPKAYLSKILQELSKHDIVSSIKGPKGGFFVNEQNKKINLIKIIDLIDGEHRLKSCVLSLNDCNSKKPCPMHEMVGKTKSKFVKKLEATTIEDLMLDIKEGKSFLPL